MSWATNGRKTGQPFVIEQNLDFALSIADRWVVLKLGEIDEEGECDPGARARVLKHLRL